MTPIDQERWTVWADVYARSYMYWLERYHNSRGHITPETRKTISAQARHDADAAVAGMRVP